MVFRNRPATIFLCPHTAMIIWPSSFMWTRQLATRIVRGLSKIWILGERSFVMSCIQPESTVPKLAANAQTRAKIPKDHFMSMKRLENRIVRGYPTTMIGRTAFATRGIRLSTSVMNRAIAVIKQHKKPLSNQTISTFAVRLRMKKSIHSRFLI